MKLNDKIFILSKILLLYALIMVREISSKETGNLGEGLACRYLERKGFYIIERNYWKKWGEIDIIAQKDGKTRFIEVKSVSRENIKDISVKQDAYRPEDNMHPWKLQRLARTIQSYLAEKSVSDETWQFDVITIYIDRKNLVSRVNMLENVIL
jgi:putative endonuclease